MHEKSYKRLIAKHNDRSSLAHFIYWLYGKHDDDGNHDEAEETD